MMNATATSHDTINIQPRIANDNSMSIENLAITDQVHSDI